MGINVVRYYETWSIPYLRITCAIIANNRREQRYHGAINFGINLFGLVCQRLSFLIKPNNRYLLNATVMIIATFLQVLRYKNQYSYIYPFPESRFPELCARRDVMLVSLYTRGKCQPIDGCVHLSVPHMSTLVLAFEACSTTNFRDLFDTYNIGARYSKDLQLQRHIDLIVGCTRCTCITGCFLFRNE